MTQGCGSFQPDQPAARCEIGRDRDVDLFGAKPPGFAVDHGDQAGGVGLARCRIRKRRMRNRRGFEGERELGWIGRRARPFEQRTPVDHLRRAGPDPVDDAAGDAVDVRDCDHGIRCLLSNKAAGFGSELGRVGDCLRCERCA